MPLGYRRPLGYRTAPVKTPSLPDLPINEALPALREALIARTEVLLEAPPGAGKSTIVPLALLAAPWLKNQKILMLEPRRIAARAVANRMANAPRRTGRPHRRDFALAWKRASAEKHALRWLPKAFLPACCSRTRRSQA